MYKEEMTQMEEAAHNLANLVNTNSVNNKSVGEFVNRLFFQEHRTLQQQVVHLMIRSLIEYGKQDEKFTDGRNEYAHRMCKRLGKLADADEFIPYMPLI